MAKPKGGSLSSLGIPFRCHYGLVFFDDSSVYALSNRPKSLQNKGGKKPKKDIKELDG